MCVVIQFIGQTNKNDLVACLSLFLFFSGCFLTSCPLAQFKPQCVWKDVKTFTSFRSLSAAWLTTLSHSESEWWILKMSSEQFFYCIFAKDDGFKIETHSICLIPVLKLFLMQIVLSCAEQILPKEWILFVAHFLLISLLKRQCSNVTLNECSCVHVKLSIQRVHIAHKM